MTPSRVSSLAERGLAYCPAKRPMRITGFCAPTTSTRLICSSTLSMLVMRAGRAIGEALGAIAALQHEARAGGGFGQLLAQVHDFPTGHQRRKLAQLGQHAARARRVGILGLLQRGALAPGIRIPLCNIRGGGDRHGTSPCEITIRCARERGGRLQKRTASFGLPEFGANSIHRFRDLFRSVARYVFPDSIAEQLAARLLRAPREPLCSREHIVRDRDCSLHTASITGSGGLLNLHQPSRLVPYRARRLQILRAAPEVDVETWCTQATVQRGAQPFTVRYSRRMSSIVYSASGLAG